MIGDGALLMAERSWHVAGELAADLRDDDRSSFAAAHSLACGHGYMSGACPLSVCGAPLAAPAA